MNKFLPGFLTASILWAALAILAVRSTPPEPPAVYRGALGAVTVDDLVDDAEPAIHAYVDEDIPWLVRRPAHNLARWFVRRTVHVAIANHGPQVASGLRAVEPMSDKLFRAEYAAKVRGIRALCETDVKEFGPIAVRARAEVEGDLPDE